MTNKTDEYRAKAEHCRQMADQVVSPIDKEMWLQLAARRRNIAARWLTRSSALSIRKCGSSLPPIGCQWHRHTSDLATTKPRAKPRKIRGAKTPPDRARTDVETSHRT